MEEKSRKNKNLNRQKGECWGGSPVVLCCSHRLTVDSWQSRLAKCSPPPPWVGQSSRCPTVRDQTQYKHNDELRLAATRLGPLRSSQQVGGRHLPWSEDIIVSTQIHSASLSTWLNLGFTAASVSPGCWALLSLNLSSDTSRERPTPLSI